MDPILKKAIIGAIITLLCVGALLAHLELMVDEGEILSGTWNAPTIPAQPCPWGQCR